MDLRVLLTTGLFLATALTLAPSASAAPCASASQVDCDVEAGNCDVHAGANVITSTYAGASADCRGGGTGTRCYAEAGVGQTLDPTVERWCAF